MATRKELLQKHERRLPAGTVVYAEGTIGQEMYVIRSGRVELSKRNPNGSTRLAVLSPGDFFGETEGLGRGHHAATARVLEDATILEIGAETLVALVSESTEIATRILLQLAERAVDLNARIAALAERDLHGRVLSALSALADPSAAQEGAGCEIAISNDRLGRAAGIEESTLLNVIERLTSAGLIRRIGSERIWLAPRTRLDRYLNSPAEAHAKTRVLIVDDSPLFRAAIARALADDPHLEVVGMAEDGRRAIELVGALQPDVITMDVQMPSVSGLDAIPAIMSAHPTPILVLTSLADIDDGSIAFEALRSGALDLWPKPAHLPPWPEESQALADQLHRLARIKVSARAPREPGVSSPISVAADMFPILPPAGAGARRIAIVAETGGPTAIASLLDALPRPFPAQLLICQGFEPARLEPFAGWLGRVSSFDVRVARPGEPHREGAVLVVPPGCTVASSGEIELSGDGGEQGAADRLVSSLAGADAVNSVCVILSGAGRDGAIGLSRLVGAGGLGLVLHPGDAVIDELPRAALDEAPQCRVVSGAELPELLIRIVGVTR